MIAKIKNFFKKETVLCAGLVLAIISSFFVTPSLDYINYIDFRTLGILLSLMLVMAYLRQAEVFSNIGLVLLKKTGSVTGLSIVLVMLCFVFSMLITNDVALITFVPFAIFTLSACGKNDKLYIVVILQTLAANLGSMLTPIGNPQNLYLYQTTGYSFDKFVRIMLPYTIVSLVFIIVITIARSGKKEQITVEVKANKLNVKASIAGAILFVLCLLVVLRVIDYRVVLLVILLYFIVVDRRIILKADYALLLTFIFFFIFTGNLGNIPAVALALQSVVAGHEMIVSVLASQAISNVPATLLLAGFVSDYESLLIGVNIGGLGTLIASMASLISYKLFVNEQPDNKGRYFKAFTLLNIVLLVILIGVYFVDRAI